MNYPSKILLVMLLLPVSLNMSLATTGSKQPTDEFVAESVNTKDNSLEELEWDESKPSQKRNLSWRIAGIDVHLYEVVGFTLGTGAAFFLKSYRFWIYTNCTFFVWLLLKKAIEVEESLEKGEITENRRHFLIVGYTLLLGLASVIPAIHYNHYVFRPEMERERERQSFNDPTFSLLTQLRQDHLKVVQWTPVSSRPAEEIYQNRSAYLRAAALHNHPDRGGSTQRMQDLNEIRERWRGLGLIR